MGAKHLFPVSTTQGADGTVRVSTDILRNSQGTAAEQASCLLQRGRPIWWGYPGNGFAQFGQHFNGSGQARSPVWRDGRSGGLLQSGVGRRAADGNGNSYGEWDDGAGGYVRLGRDYLDCYWAQSGRIQLRAAEPGSVLGPTFYFDTQLGDNSLRQFPSVGIRAAGGPFVINTAVAQQVPGSAGLILGDNEDKQGDEYFCWTYFMAANAADSHFGHLQIGGQVFDLRTLGAAGSPENPQVGTVPFANGANAGISVQTPTPDKAGGFCLTEYLITIGDRLNPTVAFPNG